MMRAFNRGSRSGNGYKRSILDAWQEFWHRTLDETKSDHVQSLGDREEEGMWARARPVLVMLGLDC